MIKQNHPLAFLAEAYVDTPEYKKQALERKIKDDEQRAASAPQKRSDLNIELQREKVLKDLEQDKRNSLEQLDPSADYVEDESASSDDPGALPVYKPAQLRDTANTQAKEDWPDDSWEPGEDELTGKSGPREPEVEPSTAKVPEALMDFRIRLVSRIITLDEIKRLEKLLKANEAPKPKLVKAGPWADTARKPTLKDLFTALKEMVNYLTESPQAPARVITGLTDSIKALQKVIASLLPKE